MNFEKETATAATVSSQRMGVLTRDTMNSLSQLDFFEGFRAWCAIWADLWAKKYLFQ